MEMWTSDWRVQFDTWNTRRDIYRVSQIKKILLHVVPQYKDKQVNNIKYKHLEYGDRNLPGEPKSLRIWRAIEEKYVADI